MFVVRLKSYLIQLLKLDQTCMSTTWTLDRLTWLTVDPWFNFRATKYLVQNGFYNFWDWFDDRKLLCPLACRGCCIRRRSNLKFDQTVLTKLM